MPTAFRGWEQVRVVLGFMVFWDAVNGLSTLEQILNIFPNTQ